MMRRFAALVLCLVFCCTMLPAALADEPSGVEDGVLTVAMECNYAPYNWSQGDDSNGAVPIRDSREYANGYDVMMAKKLCEANGWQLEIVRLDWDSLVPAVQAGVVDAVWIEELNNERCYDTYTPYDGDGEYYLGQLYYTVDSLGFVTLKCYAARDNALYTLMVLTLDSQTGAPVELWLSADTYDMAVLMAKSGEQRELPQDVPDNEWEYRLAAGTWQPDTPTTDSLRGYIQILGLDSLDDWTEPEDSSYTCALASENGGAVVTASSHRFSDTIYQSYDDSETLDRVYLSVNISAAG